MKRQWVRAALGAALFVSTATAARAAPCVAAGLADYLALGPAGCSIGSLEFSDFSLPSILGAAVPIDAAGVALTPLAGPGGRGFAVASTQAAGSGDFLQLRFGFNVVATSGRIGRARVELAGAQAGGDGVTTLLEDLCIGAQFSDPTNLVCGATPATLVTLVADGTAITTDALDLLPPDPQLGVVADLGVDGGLSGSASFTAGNLLFTVVPLPSTLALLGFGAFGFVAMSRVRRREQS